MRVVRRVLLGLIVPILILLLFATTLSTGLVQTFANPAPIKHIISDSGIYNSVLDNSLDQASPMTVDSSQIPFSDILLRKAAVATFTPQFIKQNTETVVDSIYGWLNGETPLPDFYIDLSSQKQAFAANIAQSVQQRLASLPACTTLSILTDFDALNATCLPVGITPNAAAASLKSDILNGQGFLDNPIITADSIRASGDSQSIFTDQLKNAPQFFHDAKLAPSVLAALSVLAAIAVILLSRVKKLGLRKVGFTLLISGVLMLLFAWGINHIVMNNIVPKISLDTSSLQTSIRSIMVDIVKSIDRCWWYFGAIYSALGLAAILGITYWAKKSGNQPRPEPTAKETKDNEKPPVTVEKNTSKDSPAPKKTKKIIVQ